MRFLSRTRQERNVLDLMLKSAELTTVELRNWKTSLLICSGVVPLAVISWLAISHAAPQSSITITVAATSRQARLSYVAPNAAACTVEVSEAASFAPVVDDVNPTLFAGSNKDDRPGSYINGVTHLFVVGTIQNPAGTVPVLASDGKKYSRALHTNSVHYARVTCGANVGTTSWTQKNIPLGKTYAETMPMVAAGSYGFPTVSLTDRNQTFIDPTFGTKIRKITLPGDDSSPQNFIDSGSQWICAQQTTNDSSGTSGYLCTLPSSGGATYLYWVNTAASCNTNCSRYLGRLVIASGQLAGFGVSYVGTTSSKFDSSDPTRVYQIFPDTSANMHVTRCQLPASGNSFYNSTVAASSNAPCSWTDLTPGPNHLSSLLQTFDSTYDKTKFAGFNYQWVQGNYLLFSALRGFQDSYGWLGAYNLSTNTVQALIPLWKRRSNGANFSWCAIHTPHQALGAASKMSWTAKDLAQGGTGQGPYRVTLNAAMNSTQTTISLSSNTPSSTSLDNTLYDVQANDEIQVDSERMFLVSSVSGTTWNVTRHVSGTAANAHSSGALVYMECRAHYSSDVAVVTINWWDFVNDPHGNDTSGTNLAEIADGINGHDGWANSYKIGEGGWNACANVAAGVACPNTFFISDSAQFAGVGQSGSGNAWQKHPSPPQQSNAPAAEKIWALDTFEQDADPAAIPTSFTIVTGSLWKFTNTNYTLQRKKLPMLAIAGAHPLLDVSSAATGNIIGGLATDNYKYCVANVANECRTGSLPGSIYVNAPNLTTSSTCPTGSFTWSNDSSICISNIPAFGQSLVQIGIVAADSTGKYLRSLTTTLGGYKLWDLLANAHATPDGKLAMFPADQPDSRHVWAVELPPWPGVDATLRNNFIQKAITVAGLGGADNAIIEFGYDPNFSCTSRNEVCVSAAANNPFFFASESYSGNSCSLGCTINIPIVPDRVVYYRIKWRSGSSTLQTSGTFLITEDSAPAGGGSNDTTLPTVSITAPTANATVSGTVNIDATASDNVGISSVQFKVDGGTTGLANAGLDNSLPYSVSWDTTTAANGTHQLTAVATDTSSNSTTSSAVAVTVSNGGGGGDPSTISGLKLWLKADALTLSDGSAVASWPDSSGNANNAFQNNVGARPTFKTNQLNGKPAVQFNAGGSTSLDLPNFTSSLTAASVFILVKLNADPPATYDHSGFWNFGANPNTHFTNPDDSAIHDDFGSNVNKTVGNPAASLTSWRLYEVRSAAGIWEAYLDGTLLFTTTSNTVAFSSLPQLGKSFGSYYLDGYVAEIGVYNRDITSTERQTIRNYINTKYGFSSGGDPSTISGLKLWLKADALTLSDGSAVASWPDSSGNANNAFQNNAGARPTFRTNQLNGKPAVQFNAGGSTSLDLPNFTSSLTAASVFILVKLNADPPATYDHSGFWNFGTNPNAHFTNPDDSAIHDDFGSNVNKTVGNPAASLTSWRLYEVRSAAGIWEAYLDGTLLFTTTSNTVAFSSLPQLGKSFGSYYLDGYVAEIGVYNRDITSTERQTIRTYLNAKYGLTIP